jgi:predicted AAA+ superfamily ATPase
MNELQILHNQHHNGGLAALLGRDPHLQRWAIQPLRHVPALLEQLPEEPGVYTIGGGRQIGKTTTLKLFIKKLLEAGRDPASILFVTGELITDHQTLIHEVQDFLQSAPRPAVLIVDEVTYIRDWDKGVKFMADAGLLSGVRLILTGSDLLLIQEARMRFPGRRGRADQVDFHIRPLTFGEFIKLWNKPASNELFEQYMIHGGYLTAINDYKRDSKVSLATLRTYSDWIRGDVIKKGRSEGHLKSLLSALILRQGSQVSWNGLCGDLSIDHPKTVSDYVEILERLDVLNVVSAFDEARFVAAPKKAKKIFFTDPFIFQSVQFWLQNSADIPPISPQIMGVLAEGIVHQHLRKSYLTYYIKAEGEVDVVAIKEGSREFTPIEVKWTTQIRPKDLKQIRKYKTGVVWAKWSEPDSLPPTKKLIEML